MAEVLDQLEIQPWSELQLLHERLLNKQLDYLYARSPFYQRKLVGIPRGEITGLADLKHLPFTTKEDIRQSLSAQPPLGSHLAADPAEVVQIQASSGTTGIPTFVAGTSGDLRVWNTMGSRAFFANGFRPHDWIMQVFAMGRGFVGGLLVVQHLQHLGCAVIPLGAESGTERLLKAIHHLRPVAMIGTPSMVTHLGEAAADVLGEPASALSVRKISVGGEPGGGVPAIRHRMEGLWGADVRDMMGGADFGCAYWGECEVKDGMHLCSQGCLHVEIIDPDTLESLPIEAGVTGELVYTAIARQASPLLRYRMGDVVTVNSTSCPCGRTGYKIKVHGRADDMLIVRGVNVFPASIKDLVMQFIPRTTGLMHILVDFEGHSTFEPLQIRIEHADQVDDVQLPILQRDLENRIRDALTVRAIVTLVPPGSMERPGAQKEKLVLRSLPSVR